MLLHSAHFQSSNHNECTGLAHGTWHPFPMHPGCIGIGNGIEAELACLIRTCPTVDHWRACNLNAPTFPASGYALIRELLLRTALDRDPMTASTVSQCRVNPAPPLVRQGRSRGQECARVVDGDSMLPAGIPSHHLHVVGHLGL